MWNEQVANSIVEVIPKEYQDDIDPALVNTIKVPKDNNEIWFALDCELIPISNPGLTDSINQEEKNRQLEKLINHAKRYAMGPTRLKELIKGK